MSSAIYILDEGLNLLIHREYKEELNNDFIIEKFKELFIESLPVSQPILYSDGVTYVCLRCDDVYMMSPVYEDVNVMRLMTFLNKFSHVLRSYFIEYHFLDRCSKRIDSDLIKDNYILIYELFDETLDWGLPQLTEFSILKEYVKPIEQKVVMTEKEKDNRKSDAAASLDKQIEADINSSISRASTAMISWRPKGIFYNKNEFFMDFDEHLKFKYNFNAKKVIVNHISGQILCRSFLSGMPALKLELNEQIEQKNDNSELLETRSIFTNVNYHQCVELSAIHNSSLSFVPPDGEFKLLFYQILQTSVLKPLILVKPLYRIFYKEGRFILRIKAEILTSFKRKYSMTDIAIKFPLLVPLEPFKIDFDQPLRYKTKLGKVTHNLDSHSVTWHIAKLEGLSKGDMMCDFQLVVKPKLFEEYEEDMLHNKQSKNDLIYFDLPSEASNLKGKSNNMALSSAMENVLDSRAENKDILVTVAFKLSAMLYSGLKVNYLQIKEPQIDFHSFSWVKYKTICEGDDYSFVVSDDQIQVDLTEQQIAESGNIQTSPNDNTKEPNFNERDNDNNHGDQHNDEIAPAVQSSTVYSYGDRVIDFEEYKIEGEGANDQASGYPSK
ncbi:hypothetical protein FOA43_003586 [Brettanomyces nanus]|uniref:MHD domain-containing protein n=1 Tax=Eeniella nana TaxID=13502 RepID=A0A875RQ89_EENNA|nr:uncharacterized protein FOA43_003586 [Brettanomyces nanus]QPG76200.1 hypothetical protein FOA43_003586 [Brettanomyces nanus]